MNNKKEVRIDSSSESNLSDLIAVTVRITVAFTTFTAFTTLKVDYLYNSAKKLHAKYARRPTIAFSSEVFTRDITRAIV